jgi:hypothetical protein
MTQGDGRPARTIATLNTGATKFGNGGRRIEHLKQLAYDCNLTAEQAREYGKLSATATWEKLLLAHGLEFEPKIEINNSTIGTASQESSHQIGLTDWIDWAQALALALASVGFAVLLFGLFPRVNPLNLFPVKITIQIGQK